MTVEPDAESDGGTPASEMTSTSQTNAPMTVGAVLKAATTHLRRDPILVVPFALAGLLVALADWLRRWDPIPVARPDSVRQTFDVQYSMFPEGTARTIRPVDALVDLQTTYLLGAVALELLVWLAVGLAGWLTITRVLGSERRVGSLANYLGFVTMVTLVPRVLGSPSVEFDSLLFGVLALAAVSLVFVRTFLLPGLLAAGWRFTTALRESVRASRGRGWTLFGLVVLFGLASGGLARIPFAGGFLSTAVVALVHAVSLAVLLQRGEEMESGEMESGEMESGEMRTE